MGEFAKKCTEAQHQRPIVCPPRSRSGGPGELLPGGIGPGGPKAWLTTIERS